MIEILKPFGVGQYQSSIGFCDFAAARFGAALLFLTDRFTARFMARSLLIAMRATPRAASSARQFATGTTLRRTRLRFARFWSGPDGRLNWRGTSMFRVSIAGTVAAGLLVAPWCTGAVAQNAPVATTPTPKCGRYKEARFERTGRRA